MSYIISAFTGLSSFLVALSQVLSNFAAVFLVDRFGRKILLFASELLMSVSIFTLGFFFYMKENMAVTCQVNT